MTETTVSKESSFLRGGGGGEEWAGERHFYTGTETIVLQWHSSDWLQLAFLSANNENTNCTSWNNRGRFKLVCKHLFLKLFCRGKYSANIPSCKHSPPLLSMRKGKTLGKREYGGGEGRREGWGRGKSCCFAIYLWRVSGPCFAPPGCLVINFKRIV